MAKYDAIIIGAGPNGLVTGAYLSKAGLKVLILERKTEAGGGLATEEVTIPGFLHNTHSIYHMMVDYAPPYRDLGVEEKYNCYYVYPKLQFAMSLSNGKALCLYTDVEKSCQSLARFSQKDAATYRELHHKLDRYMNDFLAPATYVPPVSAIEQAAKLEATEMGREIMAFSEKTPLEIVEELFENEHVRAMMLYIACHWGLDYDSAGIGYLALLNLNRATHYRLCVGGSHMLSQVLHKVILENGGMIWGSQRIKRIIVQSGAARGVELENGAVVEANKAVISSIDPHQTFLKLVGEKNLDQDFVERIKDWKWETWSLFSTHLALTEAPNFGAAASEPEIDRAFVHILGYETTGDLISHWQSIEKGELKDNAGFNCCFPSVHDPSQAPRGKHTGLISQMAPYRIKGNSQQWYSAALKNDRAEKCLAVLQKYAPNMTKDKILWLNTASPLDIENKFSDMVEGSIKQGQYHPLQMGYLRPHEDCSENRTPIKNLYLCGSSCHSGGMVTFGPGYLAANTIAEDLGLTRWWREPEIVTRSRQKGLL